MVQIEVVTKTRQTIGIKTIEKAAIVVTEAIIIHIFCNVDDQFHPNESPFKISIAEFSL